MNKGPKIASKATDAKIRPDTGVEPQKSFCKGFAMGQNGLRVVAVANEFAVGDETTELTLPYGTYPAGRRKTKNGSRYVMQRWDRTAAEAVANQLQDEISNGAPGIPVYIGHPDVPEVAHRFPNKAAVGWITSAQTGDDSAVMVVVWNDKPFTKKEFAWFSPYWIGSITKDDGATATVNIDEIGSIGLTNTPNIHDFRIPNEASGDDFEETNNNPERDNTMKEQLIQLLGLPGDSDDEAIVAAVTAVKDQADQMAALKADKEAADKAKADAEEAKEEIKEAFENERQGRVDMMINGALADGRITVAEVPLWKKRLGENFAVNSVAIANEKPKFKTTATASKSETMAVANSTDRITAIQDAVQQHMSKGLDYDAAYRAAKKSNPELFQK